MMAKSANGTQRESRLGSTVPSFKYFGAFVPDDGSKSEILSRFEQATAALTQLKPIWRGNNISLAAVLHFRISVCL